MTIEKVPYSLPRLVQGTVDMLLSDALNKDLSLSFNIASNVPDALLGDPIRIRQILTNLIGNAIKFTIKGGVSIKVMRKKNSLLFEVQDSGIGIAQAAQKNIVSTLYTGRWFYYPQVRRHWLRASYLPPID